MPTKKVPPLFLFLMAVSVSPRWANAEPPPPKPVEAAPEAEPAPPPPAPEGQVAPILKGKPALFTGLLVPEDRFHELLAAELRVRELEAKLKVKEEEGRMLELMYRRRLEKAAAVPWYDSPTFNRWLGFGLGIAATGLAVYGASELATK